MLDIQRPVVIVAAGGQRHIGAETIPNLLIGLLRLSKPQVQAIFDTRA